MKAEEFSILDAIIGCKLKKNQNNDNFETLTNQYAVKRGARAFYLGKSFFAVPTCAGLKSDAFSITK